MLGNFLEDGIVDRLGGRIHGDFRQKRFFILIPGFAVLGFFRSRILIVVRPADPFVGGIIGILRDRILAFVINLLCLFRLHVGLRIVDERAVRVLELDDHRIALRHVRVLGLRGGFADNGLGEGGGIGGLAGHGRQLRLPAREGIGRGVGGRLDGVVVLGHFAVGHLRGVDGLAGVVQPGDGIAAQRLGEHGGIGRVCRRFDGLGGPALKDVFILLGGLAFRVFMGGHLARLDGGGVDHVALVVQPGDGVGRGLLVLFGGFGCLGRLRNLFEHRRIGGVAGHLGQLGVPALEHIGRGFRLPQGRIVVGRQLAVGHLGLVDQVALVVQPGDGILAGLFLEGGGIGGVRLRLDHLGLPASEGIGIFFSRFLGGIVMGGLLAGFHLCGIDDVALVVLPCNGELIVLLEGGGIGNVPGHLCQLRLPAGEDVSRLARLLDRILVGGHLAISDLGLVYDIALVVHPGNLVLARFLLEGRGVGGVRLGLGQLGFPPVKGIGILLGGLFLWVLVGGQLAVLDLGEVDQLALVVQPGDHEGALGLLELGLVGHVLRGLGNLGVPAGKDIGILPVAIIGGILGLFGFFALLHLVLLDGFPVDLPLDGVVGLLLVLALALRIGRREWHAGHQQRHAQHDGKP